MISFYPGPSKVYPQVAEFMQDAFREGILSINHRSQEFVEISQNTIKGLKTKLDIPEDYWIFFISSATEAWEIIAQSLIENKSFHIYNGAFGKKWFEYTQKLRFQSLEFGVQSSEFKSLPDNQRIQNPKLPIAYRLSATDYGRTMNYSFDSNEAADLEILKQQIPEDNEIICLTHNETSNGTALPLDFIAALRQNYPPQLIAIDATSSLGGVQIDFSKIDICCASVQKCLGLPAGLGLLICSPRTIEKAFTINERNHYNSLAFMVENMQNFQTTYTPNVLNIYLLNRVMEIVPPIHEIHQKITKQAKDLYAFFSNIKGFTLLIQNEKVHSDTVIAVAAPEESIREIKLEAKKQNIILGNGYEEWKNTSFRIANFPAITNQEIELLKDFFAIFTKNR